MPKPAILQPGQSYTFRQYFEMSYDLESLFRILVKILQP